jgi:hypothetical protein
MNISRQQAIALYALALQLGPEVSFKILSQNQANDTLVVEANGQFGPALWRLPSTGGSILDTATREQV